MKNLLSAGIAGIALLLALSNPVHAAEWKPDKDFTWIVGYPPGGSVDLFTRIAARQLSIKTGRAVVVANRPGADGIIAMGMAAKSAPDGYTLVSVGGPVISKNTVPEFGNDLVPIGLLASSPIVLVAASSAHINGAAELFASIKKSPGKWSFASSGTGSPQHLAGVLLNVMLGTDLVHVPYKGGAAALNDVLGGQVPLAMLGPSTVLPFIASGRLTAIAVTTKNRSLALPNVPTLSESGLAGFDASQWIAAAVPAKVEKNRVEQLHTWMDEIIASPEMQKALQDSGMSPGTGSVESLQKSLQADTIRWKQLAKERHLLLD
jgi:tripartite-type tricarboxylate transporter receptor subunit TctC